MRRNARKLGLIGMLLVLISAADSIQDDGPALSIIVNGNPTATSKDFLIQNSGILYLSLNELFPALGAKPDYNPDLSVFYLNSKGLKIAANLKTNHAIFAGEEMEFAGGFWRDSKLYISEDFITDVYARARGWEISIDKPESVKNYQSAFRLPDKIKRDPVKVVVIDPGHGGESIGASSSDGFREKDLTLAIALKLRDKLKSVPGLKVYLTREEDREVALDDRPEFANKFNADLFLSIHANACDAQSASGFETYFMSLNASDEDSRKIALWENLDLSGEQKNHSQELSRENLSELDMILGDMAQSEHLAESEVFAKIIQTNLAMIMKNPNRGVKQAPFRVLMGANMPAALVEVGFITNAKDRRSLLDEKNQDRIVSILAESILDFRELKAKRLGLTEVNANPKPKSGPVKTSVNQNRAAQIR
jgi:N-acetylmuramoyl-L-alanine amidase